MVHLTYFSFMPCLGAVLQKNHVSSVQYQQEGMYCPRCFCEAVEKVGLPYRIRADHRVDDLDMVRYTLYHPSRGPIRGSLMSGKSVHNQRIERLWCDLYVGLACIYYEAFRYLKDQDLL